jgi:hypothetical protein
MTPKAISENTDKTKNPEDKSSGFFVDYPVYS